MLDRINSALTRSISENLFEDHERPECQLYFGEVASHLSPGEFDALMSDLDAFDRVGLVTPRIAEMKKRARCIADAERIIARLDHKISDIVRR